MNAPVYRSGSWCDVSPWIDGRLIQVTSDGALVRCYLEDVIVWERRATEALLFLRCAVQGGMLLTVSQGHDSGQAWLVNDRMVQGIGPTFGVQPVGIDACSAYVVRSSAAYDRVSLVSQSLPSGAPGSSQGLSDVQPDGTLWWADLHRSLVINGVTFTYPNQRKMNGYTLTVGQVDPAGIAIACERGIPHEGSYSVKITRVLDGDAFEPHLAPSPNGRVAICARTPKGAAYVTTTIQELS